MNVVFRVGIGVGCAAALAYHLGCGGSSSSPPPPPAPTFTLTATPNTLAIPAGQQGKVVITVTRNNGFSEAVNLSLDGAPTGVTGAGTVSASGTSAEFTITVGPAVAPQTYSSLNIKGQSSTLTVTTAFVLVVAPPVTAGYVSPDLVQASGALQRAGTTTNQAVAGENVQALVSKNANGSVEVRHGFKPGSRQD